MKKKLISFLGAGLLLGCIAYGINIRSEGYSVANTATVAVNGGNNGAVCKKVTNNCGQDIFVPTKTDAEWQGTDGFINKKPSCVSVSSCAVGCALPWGGTIDDGQSVLAYQNAYIDQYSNPKFNLSCNSITRTCNNGVLGGDITYKYPSCSSKFVFLLKVSSSNCWFQSATSAGLSSSSQYSCDTYYNTEAERLNYCKYIYGNGIIAAIQRDTYTNKGAGLVYECLEYVNGVCGVTSAYSKPTTNLCTKGTATTVQGSGPRTWQCLPLGVGGYLDSCTAAKRTAVCGNYVTEPGEICDGDIDEYCVIGGYAGSKSCNSDCLSRDDCVKDSGTCFVAGTKITLGDGTTKSIEKVQTGDVVIGSENTKNKVIQLFKLWNKGKLYSINGSDYFVTATHPFMTTEGWKSFDPIGSAKENPNLTISELHVGDILIKETGLQKIYITDSIIKPGYVYNFKLNNNHTYYADGYLVHNPLQKQQQ